jgi:hypothetical protein
METTHPAIIQLNIKNRLPAGFLQNYIWKKEKNGDEDRTVTD